MIIHVSQIYATLIIAVAVSAIAMSMTQGTIFAPFRTAVMNRSKWLGELFSCFFCLSHWVAFTAVAVFRPRPVETAWYAADLILVAFATIGLSVVYSGFIFRVFLSANEMRVVREAREAASGAGAALDSLRAVR